MPSLAVFAVALLTRSRPAQVGHAGMRSCVLRTLWVFDGSAVLLYIMAHLSSDKAACCPPLCAPQCPPRVMSPSCQAAPQQVLTDPGDPPAAGQAAYDRRQCETLVTAQLLQGGEGLRSGPCTASAGRAASTAGPHLSDNSLPEEAASPAARHTAQQGGACSACKLPLGRQRPRLSL